MEIEKKYLIASIPENIQQYTSYSIEQAYICTNPVLRIRKKDEQYIFTYKSTGLMSREEVETPITKDAYYHLLSKADGNIITKTRYLIPDENNLTIELDIFHGCFDGLALAEVEFTDEANALSYIPPKWFSEDVTFSSKYHNSTLSSSDPCAYFL